MPSRPPDLPALKALLEQQYPRAYRIAVALCGDPLLARAVTRDVLRQSLRVHGQWTDDRDAARWFAHHTVLTARQAIAWQRPDPANDAALLLSDDPLFITILRTMRFIPTQQREAFLLHHGEQFDRRQLATAMDCSADAAANHLVAATGALRPVAADRLGDFTAALPQLLARVVPPRETIAMEAERETRRYVWPRRLKRWIGWPLLWICLAAGAYFGWHLWRMLEI
jgi:DNA-directed RNA polymerase specialized sigma24 family protein